jgi:DeoR/GlpR family transcriptional regulator of sugar metabolism
MARFIVARGTVALTELASAFSVSLMTVHRDLRELADQGLIRRFRGGASALPSGVFESSVRYRMSAMTREKSAIAREALTLVEPGMSVLLDEGTTTFAVARLLADIAPLTVITSYLETIKLLCNYRNIRLLSVGGEYRASHDSFIGVHCIESLRATRADLALLSTSAIGRGAAFHQEQEIVLVKRAMMECASRRVLLVDHSKLGSSALYRFAQLDEFDLIITDDQATPEQVEDLSNHAIPFRLATTTVLD